MKITKKQPLRPRGRSDEKRQSTKDAIREAYANGPQKEVQIIPAKKDLVTDAEKKKLRVCAYCRVSTEEDNQASSYELQVQNYTKMIQENPEWEFAGIFADEGISGTSVLHREHFLEMIEKCKAGEIDLIITKQVSRFARNVLDSLNYIFMLRKLDPPVGVYFETEKLNTLDRSSDMVITVLSLVAQSESEQKSNSLKWSFKRRRAQGLGIYPNWSLLGYKGHDWEVDEDEADVVRTIYSLYLEGYSSTQIADLLTKSGILTVKGLSTWSSGSVLGILRNEKYCGDALCQKSYTVDFLTKKKKINEGEIPQYYVEGNHEAIISPEVFELVQQELERRKQSRGRHSGVHLFSGKIRCGQCGEWYGSKTWHSNSKYRRVVWQCNHKYDGDEKCTTAHLTDDDIKGLFVSAVNQLITQKDAIITALTASLDTAFDLTALKAEQAELESEMTVVSDLIQKCIYENAHVALDQVEYQKRYDGLTARFDTAKARFEAVEDAIRSKQSRRATIEDFLATLKDANLVDTFDTGLWCGLVDFVTVHSKDDVRFTFKNGLEIRA